MFSIIFYYCLYIKLLYLLFIYIEINDTNIINNTEIIIIDYFTFIHINI